MKYFPLFVIISLILFTNSTHAQPWLRNLPKGDSSDREANFYEKQRAFNEYWNNKEVVKGKGWKQFKRWEYFMETRVDDTGFMPGGTLWGEFTKKKEIAALKSVSGNWSALGPFDTPTLIDNTSSKRGSGRINCIAFHPTDATVFYVGSPSGGVWKTIDGGINWATTTDALPSIGVSDIAIHPIFSDTVYIATGDGDGSDTYSAGMLVSGDGGATWNMQGTWLPIQSSITFSRLLIHPSSPNILIAASNTGIWRTTNGGVTWTTVQSGNFKDLEFKPGNPSVVYAASYSGSGNAKVYTSTDTGLNFSETINGMNISGEVNRIALAVTPANPNVIYALCSSSSDDGFHSIYLSTIGGSVWTQKFSAADKNLLGWETTGNDSGGQGWYDLSLAVSPVDQNIVYVGGVNIWQSTDGGSNWSINAHWYGGGGAAYVHADEHVLAYNPLNNNLYSGNDGGLYRTTNGTSWTDLSDGLEILQIYRLGSSATNEGIVVTGAQDNGSFKYNNGTWNAWIGGDGMECIVDHTNPQILYGSIYYGQIQKSTDGGYTSFDISPTTGNNWITPYIMHPTDPLTLFAGYTEVYKTTDGGISWSTLTSGLTGGVNLQSLIISPTNFNYIYCATYNTIWRTTDGGTTWNDITGSLSGTIKYIAVSQIDPDKIWVSFSGFQDNEKVYQSLDGGANWTNFSDGLPNVPVNCILYENNSNGGLYAGTDLGVYYRDNSLASWIDFSDGLPNVIAMELEIQYATKKIRVATYGRGLWESDLYSMPAFPDAQFDQLIVSHCKGIVNFYDISSGVPDAWIWDFGDGNVSELQNPVHIFSSLGSYAVQLIVSNSFGSDTVSGQIVLSQDSVTGDFTVNSNVFCSPPANVQFENLSDDADSFLWYFGDGDSSTTLHPAHTYLDYGYYDVTLVAYSPLCQNDTVVMPGLIEVDQGGAGTVILPMNGIAQTQTCCTGTLFDSGGDGNYQNSTTSQITISPLGAQDVTVTFISFDVEPGSGATCNYDYIELYDGTGTNAPLIGRYCNTTGSPGTIVSTGGSVTIKQFTDQGLTLPGFEAQWFCTQVTVAPTAAFYVHDTLSCSGLIQFVDSSDNGPTLWSWDFGDDASSNLQHPVHSYAANGTYSVTLIVSNSFGTDTLVKQDYISVSIPGSPLTTSAGRCGQGTLNLSASGDGVVYWYDDEVSGNLIDTGFTFTTPILSQTTSFFGESRIVSPYEYTGKPDNSGGGGSFGNPSFIHYLVFDCYSPMELVSVKVYATGAGNRHIALRNSSQTILQEITVYVPDGESRVILNFSIPAGTDLQLAGLESPDLFRNNAGAAYPYEIQGKISVKYSSASGSPYDYYYFFYDWEVKEPDCVSSRAEAVATVINPTVIINPIADTIYTDQPDTVVLTADSIFQTYFWSDGGTGETFAVSSYGWYGVIVELDSCLLEDSVFIDYPTGSKEINSRLGIHIYPNPGNGQITINVGQPITIDYDLVIYSLPGKLVYHGNVHETTTSIDVTYLSKGVYVLRMTSVSEVVNKKVIIK